MIAPPGLEDPTTTQHQEGSMKRFSEMAEKRGGRWVYLMDHASFEPAPAAPDSHVRY